VYLFNEILLIGSCKRSAVQQKPQHKLVMAVPLNQLEISSEDDEVLSFHRRADRTKKGAVVFESKADVDVLLRSIMACQTRITEDALQSP